MAGGMRVSERSNPYPALGRHESERNSKRNARADRNPVSSSTSGTLRSGRCRSIAARACACSEHQQQKSLRACPRDQAMHSAGLKIFFAFQLYLLLRTEAVLQRCQINFDFWIVGNFGADV